MTLGRAAVCRPALDCGTALATGLAANLPDVSAVTAVAEIRKVTTPRTRPARQFECVTMRLLRSQLLRAPRFLIRLCSQTFGPQRLGQRLVYGRLLRRQFHGAAQLRHGRVYFVHVEQSLAESVMSARQVGINRDRLTEGIGGEIELLFLQEGHSQIECGLEVGGIKLQ